MRWMLMVLVVGIGFVASGCNSFAVKNTDGLKAFLTDQTAVERTALRLRDRFADPNSKEYKQADSAYGDVVLASTQFVRNVKLDAQVRNAVNVTADTYAKDPSNVQKEFQDFRKEAEQLLGTSALGMGLGEEAADFVTGLIGAVIKLHKEAKAQAVARLEETLDGSLMLEYGHLTSEALRKKYTSSQ